MQHKLAVQLYTLREECSKDFPGTLKALKEMGWAGVQLAGYHGYEPKELAELIYSLGLQTAGMHVSYDRIINELEQVAEEALLFRTRDIICPSLPADLRNEEGYRKIRQQLNEAAAAVADRNLRISYHNHAFEFDTMIEATDALNYLLEPVPDNLIFAELDVYWIKKAGRDIESYIAPFENRMPIIHLKDMTDDEEQMFAPIGTGSIAFDPIIRWGEQHGIEWYVAEQDACQGSPMNCVQTSYTNLIQTIQTIDSN
ncbi:sugar phosphate isomerase/epimerase family protein [Paenibacillus sp. IITD108]|uniref:sugar phosphate isomerase/epimerase family protein n=1 Tax=Paenibacillus sp. IITD108 TaxID=3116649 RepID=UPI002F3EB5D0